MNTLPSGSDEALAPVRAALAASAQARVGEIESAAQADADAALAAADNERARIRRDADSAGAAEATSSAALISSRQRRVADEVILAQREAIRVALHESVLAAAARLTADPRYPDILKGLKARAVRVLGPKATVTEDEQGGLKAVAGTRAIDLTLRTLAERKLESMSTEVASLWSE